MAFLTSMASGIRAQVSNFVGSGSTGCTDGTGTAASFGYNYASNCVDASGNLYVAEYPNHIIRKITPSGVVTTFAGVCSISGSTDGTGSGARFFGPLAMEVDGSGNLYVAEYLNHTIRKITPSGVVTTFAGNAGVPGSSDGTGTAARFSYPRGIAIDGSGNLYVADYGSVIRKITPAGVVTTIAGVSGSYGSADGTGAAARFNYAWGLDCDAAGNLYVADFSNHTIRKVIPSTGVVSTIAGSSGIAGSTNGTSSAARFNAPMDVTVAADGNIYVSDYSNHTIRKITTSGVVTTFAGSPGAAGTTNGSYTAARFNGPGGLEYSAAAGAIYLIDQSNYRIRKIIVDGNAALNFDGTNDRVSIPHKSYQVGMSSITLEAWVYITGSSGNFRNIIMKGNYGYGMAIDFNDKLGYWSNSSYSNCPRTAASIPYNQWTHVAVVVVQGVSTTFYINGANAGSSTASGHTTINSGSNDSLYLGFQGSGCNCNYFSGSMDEVHIWNTARTASQIAAGMNCSINSATNLIANYNFNDGEPGVTNTGKDSLSDKSGNWNKGKLLNFALNGSTSNWASPAIGQEIEVVGNNVVIIDGNTTTSTSDSTNFGVVANGSMRRHTIRNNGSASIKISSITLTGTHASDFQIIGAPSTVAAGASASFYIKINTTVMGSARTATVNINNNDCDEALYNYNIEAQATSPGATLSFDGNSDNIRVAHNSLLNPSTAMTIEAWVYRTANQYSTVVAKWDDDNNNRGYMLNFGELGNNSKLCFVATNTGNWLPSPKIQWETNTSLNLNQWYHVAITFTQSGTNNIKYYLNGVLTDQTTWNYSINASNPINLLIGGYDGPGNGQNAGANSRYFAGNLDEVRIWNRELCQSEIQNNMNCEIATTASGLLVNYHFNQGNAGSNNSGVTTLTDVSGNGLTGTLNSFALTGTSSNWIAPGAVTSGVSCNAYLPSEINVKGNNVTILDNSTTISLSDSTSFGNITPGTKRRFTIENSGSGVLNINSINVSGANASEFTITSAPTTVAAGSSARFFVTFNPTSAGNKYATITISNNDCNESSYDFAIYASSGAPGGVASNINVWLKGNTSAYTDNGVTVAASGQLVQQWNDVSNNLVFRQTSSANKPTLNNSINYNPALEFFGNNFIDLTTTLGIGSTQDYTYFAVFFPKTITNGTASNTSGSYIIDRQSATNEMASLKFSGTNNITHQYQYNNGTGLGANVGSGLATNSAYIAEFHRDYNVEFGLAVNGGVKTTSTSNSNDLTPPALRLGRHATTVNAGFVGELGEIIVYGSYPSTAELNRINSYLAIKYGITLDQSIGQNYVSSTGTVIYNAAAGGTKDTFDQEITGIGRDDASALDQRQSKSVETNSMLTIGHGTIAVNNVSNTNTFTADQSFFIAGHNGRNADSKGTSDYGISYNPLSGTNESVEGRLNRVWSATETGTVGTLKLRFDMSKVQGVSGLNSNDLQYSRLLVDADGIFGSGATSIPPSLYDNSTGIVEFDWNFASGTGFFFTVATSNASLTPLPVTWLNTNAKWNGSHAQISWKTAQEDDTYMFKVERSINGSAFATIGTVSTKATGGNNQLLEYKYQDANIREKLDGTVYYRIRWEENTGKFEYSPIMPLFTSQAEHIKVFPNPASSVLVVNGKTTAESLYTITLRDMTGASIIHSTHQSLVDGTMLNYINVADLPRGTYSIEIQSENIKKVDKIILSN